VQLIVGETSRYVQLGVLKSVNSLTFSSRIRKWEDVTVDEVDIILTLEKLELTIKLNF
jgi:hypothetical protein